MTSCAWKASISAVMPTRRSPTLSRRDIRTISGRVHFYQAMTAERFVKLGIEAARLGLRVNCVISRDIEYGLSAYEAIDKEVSIRDRRWVMIHVNQATDAQIRRMKALGVIATVVPGFLWMAGDRYGLDKLGGDGIPIRRLLDGGVPVALSTDGVPYSMLWAAWEAITRWDEDGQRHLGEVISPGRRRCAWRHRADIG